MSSEVEKGIVIVESEKSEVLFEKYKSGMIRAGIGWAVFFFFLFLLCGTGSWGFILAGALTVEGIVFFAFLSAQGEYKDYYFVVTNKGLTIENRGTGYEEFIPVSHISILSCADSKLCIHFVNEYQKRNLRFLKNANELKAALDDLIYTTGKKKEVVVLDNAAAISEVKKYKELLDSGIISQEEFDKKKKQLLDL